jgi:hypothetical protein
MSDPYSMIAARRVSNWTSLGIKLPKPLSQALDVYEALRYAEVERPVAFDLASVTADNAEEKIREFAEQLMPTRTIDRFSTLAEAKRRALDLAGRDVIAKARTAVPEVVKQLAPKFDRAAIQFTEAIAVLPENITSEELVSAGPAALEAYQAAQSASAEIARVADWVDSLEGIPGLATERLPLLRVLRPATPGQLHRLEQARDARVDSAHERLEKVYVEAARLGVEFGINTPAEAVGLRDGLRAKALVAKQLA